MGRVGKLYCIGSPLPRYSCNRISSYWSEQRAEKARKIKKEGLVSTFSSGQILTLAWTLGGDTFGLGLRSCIELALIDIKPRLYSIIVHSKVYPGYPAESLSLRLSVGDAVKLNFEESQHFGPKVLSLMRYPLFRLCLTLSRNCLELSLPCGCYYSRYFLESCSDRILKNHQTCVLQYGSNTNLAYLTSAEAVI